MGFLCFRSLWFLSLISSSKALLVDSRVSSRGNNGVVIEADFTIPTYPTRVFKTLTDVNRYSKWFTDSKKIDADPSLGKISKVGDRFTETFGLFDSSFITYEVSEFKPNSKLSFYAQESKNTVAWNNLEIEFEIEKPSILTGRGFEETLLTYKYSYEIIPAFISFEKAAMRRSILNDCLSSLAKFESLVTGTSVNTKVKKAFGPNSIKGSVNEGLTRVDQWYLPVDYKSPKK